MVEVSGSYEQEKREMTIVPREEIHDWIMKAYAATIQRNLSRKEGHIDNASHEKHCHECE